MVHLSTLYLSLQFTLSLKLISRCTLMLLLSPSPLLTLAESTSVHLLSLLLWAKHPHTCEHTYMENMHFDAQTHFVHKHTHAHAHWIFNLCPIFLPFWFSAMTAAFPRRQVFSQFSTMGTEITHIHTHSLLWPVIRGWPPKALFPQ